MKKIFSIAIAFAIVFSASAQQKKDFSVGNFDEISVGWAFEVELKQSDKPSVSIEASDEILSKIQVSVKGSELVISFTENNWKSKSNDKAIVKIGYTSLIALDLSGAVSLTCANVMKSNNFEIEMSGASKADLSVDIQSLSIELSGASDLDLTGSAKEQEVDISGASSYDAREVKSEKVDVDASGASSAKVNAEKELSAESSGASTIKYSGNPAKTYIDSSGAGSVSKD